MKKQHLALAAAIVVLICVAFVLTTIRPAPALTFWCSKVAVAGDSLSVTFNISNRTSQLYGLRPIRLERLESNQWTKVPDGIASFSQTGDFGVRSHGEIVCLTKRLPMGTRLRVVIETQTARKGLETFALRARLRVFGGAKMSLNPFDGVLFFTDPTEVVTEELVAP